MIPKRARPGHFLRPSTSFFTHAQYDAETPLAPPAAFPIVSDIFWIALGNSSDALLRLGPTLSWTTLEISRAFRVAYPAPSTALSFALIAASIAAAMGL